MAMFKHICGTCGHQFYDVTTECSKELEKNCPACEASELITTEMPIPEGEQWAEGVGCKHSIVGEHGCDGCSGSCK
jgi:DNA-directed RNA polymerase subunit RPC12/RpoP